MAVEYKSIRSQLKELNDRTAIGIAAVHGNVDEGGDRSWPGSFSTTIDGRMRTRFLWMHNAGDPPTASINYIRELPRAELPAKILDYAPDATGGVEISRTYLDTPRASEILAGLRSGAIDEMSYAYQPTVYDFEEVDGRTIRNLRQMDIYDISDVTWGMNPATAAIKRHDWKDAPLIDHAGVLKDALGDFAERLFDLQERRAKAGRVLSAANYAALEGVTGDLERLATQLRELLTSAEPKQKDDLRRLWLETQRTLATLGGVKT